MFIWFVGMLVLLVPFLFYVFGIINELYIPVFDGRNLYTITLAMWGVFGFFGIMAYESIKG